MNRAMTKTSIGIRDLVMVGVFGAIYLVIFSFSAMLGVVPLMTFLYPVLAAFLAGIPIILFLTKVNNFGLVTIFGFLPGLFVFIGGYGWYALATGVVCGFIADILLKTGNYQKWINILLSYIVLSLWSIGSMMPLFILKEEYLEPYRATQGEAFVEKTAAMISSWALLGVILLTVIAAVVGAFLGKAVLRKHFVKAGIV